MVLENPPLVNEKKRFVSVVTTLAELKEKLVRLFCMSAVCRVLCGLLSARQSVRELTSVMYRRASSRLGAQSRSRW